MYQPYIRGKQFELIGIRELLPTILQRGHTGKISPIIEPVNNSSALKIAVSELISNNVNFTIIINPQVGFFADSNAILNVLRSWVGDKRNYQIGIIFHPNIKHDYFIDIIQRNQDIIPSLSIIHNSEFDTILELLEQYKKHCPITYNVINLPLTGRRYFRNFEKETLVELDDYFKAQARNVDYLKVKESIFSEEHLHYRVDGFQGFSDYLAIGEEYAESGFLPLAVVIHLTYPHPETKKIWIKHFVSDSNNDSSDTGGKFAEALKKLISWCDEVKHDSIAIPLFRDLHENGHFPGLGIIKKLSLMNHIDVVLKLI